MPSRTSSLSPDLAKLTQEVELHLAYRWFRRLELNDKVPHHSTFSENRFHRFRQSDVFRRIHVRSIEGLPQHARAPGSTRYQRICPGCSAQVDAEHQSLHEGT